jgi:uncharacterized coiled-coil protein SlyX
MIQLYDDAIHDYLKENFKGEVAIVPVSSYWDTIAMHKEGRLQLPAIVLFRVNSTRDTQLKSWSIGRKGRIDRIRNHKKISEQAIPIQIDYTVTLLATTQDDIDELTSEIAQKEQTVEELQNEVNTLQEKGRLLGMLDNEVSDNENNIYVMND